MSEWTDVMEKARAAAAELDPEDLFYRGQVDESWHLTPSLARLPAHKETFENKVFWELQTLGGHLLPANPQPWEVLFLMQHHGLPTRLLDWTRTFAIGVAFALGEDPEADEETTKALWIMSPYSLNEASSGSQVIYVMDADFPIGYEQYFAQPRSDHYGKFDHPVVALFGDASNDRLRAQRGAFTLHRDLDSPLDDAYQDSVRKIEIPPGAAREAREFLRLAGIDSPALFPDLGTYSSYLKAKYHAVIPG